MTDKVQKIREEVVRMHNLLPVVDGDNIYINYADRICTTLEMYIDSMQKEHEFLKAGGDGMRKVINAINTNLSKEPVSEELEEAAYHNCIDRLSKESIEDFKAGAKWQKSHLWKPADGDDLPEYEREVIVFTQNYPNDAGMMMVAIGHRPTPEGFDGKSLTTGEIEHYIPKTYGKGGWNIPDVKYWLDCSIPNMED